MCIAQPMGSLQVRPWRQSGQGVEEAWMDSAEALSGEVLLPLSPAHRRLAFAAVLAAAVGACLVYTVLPPVLPALALQFGGGRQGELGAQMAMTSPSLGWLIGGGFSGWGVKRFGTRRTSIAAIL